MNIELSLSCAINWLKNGCDPAEAVKELEAIQNHLFMLDAVNAGDGVLLNEQAELLRKCRRAIDNISLPDDTLLFDSVTFGDLKQELNEPRPRGVFGD